MARKTNRHPTTAEIKTKNKKTNLSFPDYLKKDANTDIQNIVTPTHNYTPFINYTTIHIHHTKLHYLTPLTLHHTTPTTLN